jgi:hypothetical protein
MLGHEQVENIANGVAAAHLSGSTVRNIIAEPTVDSEGREALRIIIVIEPGAATRIKGDAALDILVQLQERLRQAGDERFPIIEYATEEELEEGGDS